jgi:hypothetical protein
MQFSQQPMKGAVMPKKQKKAPKKSTSKKKAEEKAAPAGPPASEGGRTRGMGSASRLSPPPKRTGKKGIGPPLDPVEDFDTPVRTEAAQGESSEEQPVQGELIREPIPPRPPALQNGKIAMHFVGYKAKKTKYREKVVYMDFSLELTDEHKKRLPREIEDAWHELEEKKYSFVGPDGLETQNLEFFLAPDDDEPALELTATLANAEISRIAERGKGKGHRITRLTLRFIADLTKDVDHFCVGAYDETVYATIEEAQRRLDE